MSRTCSARWLTATAFVVALGIAVLSVPDYASGQKDKKKKDKSALTFPPKLPDDKAVRTDTSKDFLKPSGTIEKGVVIAKTPPTVDFLYYPGQTYEGRPWSNWGDSLAVNGKYYASIGDHLALGGKGPGNGNALVFEYDPQKKAFRQLVDLVKLLDLPKDHYAPAKIHSRLDLGSDGWLYFSTHRGSTTVTSDRNHYKGDWIVRCDPKSGKSEVVVQGPVPKHCIPTSVLDGERMIFYGGTAPGTDAKDRDVMFFAYDVKNKKLLHSCGDGPPRYMILSKSTGRVYWVPGKEGAVGQLVRWDPKKGGDPVKIDAKLGCRSATQETPQGLVYTVSQGGKGAGPKLYSFDVKTEQEKELGPANVGAMGYVTSLDADPTGRYLYYVPGAHGGSEKDNSAVVQYDVKTKTRKVIAFLHPFYKDKVGATLAGTFSTAVDPKGDKVYVTWNVRRAGEKAWDCCALTVIHVPEGERKP
jgi:hypothetical protein